jgi:hypothetical protein
VQDKNTILRGLPTTSQSVQRATRESSGRRAIRQYHEGENGRPRRARQVQLRANADLRRATLCATLHARQSRRRDHGELPQRAPRIQLWIRLVLEVSRQFSAWSFFVAHVWSSLFLLRTCKAKGARVAPRTLFRTRRKTPRPHCYYPHGACRMKPLNDLLGQDTSREKRKSPLRRPDDMPTRWQRGALPFKVQHSTSLPISNPISQLRLMEKRNVAPFPGETRCPSFADAAVERLGRFEPNSIIRRGIVFA